ncbi:MAG TPA: hypothetical protein VFU21_27815 [Kofleriaceae bacterium]|nr:hypothetical protein [Kofleriaceae bacterium]
MTGRALHPAWIATLLMAGYYGLRGLLGAPVIWAILSVAALVTGSGLGGLADRLTSAEDLFMALTAVAVAGVAMLHVRRRERLDGDLARLSELARADDELLEGLRRRVVRLRDRTDRVDAAVPVWRDVAERLGSGDPAVAARAALDVCLRRTGARAGLVRRIDGAGAQNVAWRGPWSAERAEPRDIFPDRTIAAAIERGEIALGTDAIGATAEDSDLAVPLRAPGRDQVLGVLALRGVLAGDLDAAALSDVTSMASWLASAIASRASASDLPALAQPGETAPPAAAAPVLRLVVEDGT